MKVREAMATTISTVAPDRLVGILSCGNLEQAPHAEGSAATEVTLGVTRGA
jgi:hypothetical protein